MNRLPSTICFLALTLFLSSCGGPSPQAGNDYQTGIQYLRGVGVPQDKPRGLDLLTRAAAEGSPEAELTLGTMYMKGDGVANDAKRALGLFEAAAASGNVDAQYNAGLAYVRGEATSVNLQRALQWFLAAAHQGDSGAQYNVGLMLRSGEGTAKDPLTAYAWLAIAASGGSSAATDDMPVTRELLSTDDIRRIPATIQALRRTITMKSSLPAASVSPLTPAGAKATDRSATVPL